MSAIQGLMQDRPLLVSTLIDHAVAAHASVEIVSRVADGEPLRRYTYADVGCRAKQLASALTAIGVRPGDRIATLAWNDHRHLELYYAVSGIGAVLHTVNPRLDPQQIEYIMQHAEDAYLFFDVSLLPLVEALAPRLRGVKGFIAMVVREKLPSTTLRNVICYEALLGEHASVFDWPVFEETVACSLCYTSGTTGAPKGVLYSHRSALLHSYAVCTADGFALSSADAALVVVPLFHVNAWGIPYAAAMCGAKLVLPGQRLDGASLYDLMRCEGVTIALGVPTVWTNLFGYVEREGLDPSKDLRLERVVIGGAAAPVGMIETFENKWGVQVLHAWGMTETSPLGSVANPPPGLTREEEWRYRDSQGRLFCTVEGRLAGDGGAILPHDGQAVGEVEVRGPWITGSYHKDDDPAKFHDGWLRTGDVGTLDAHGFIQLTDRAKDVIKSGGEWISSMELENILMAHPDVAEAAVIGVADEKWGERPLAAVVLRPGAEVTAEKLRAFMTEQIPRWQVPERWSFIAEVPKTSVGKFSKRTMRDAYAHGDYEIIEVR